MSLQTTAENSQEWWVQTVDGTWCGSSFQARAAVTGKARSPTINDQWWWRWAKTTYSLEGLEYVKSVLMAVKIILQISVQVVNRYRQGSDNHSNCVHPRKYLVSWNLYCTVKHTAQEKQRQHEKHPQVPRNKRHDNYTSRGIQLLLIIRRRH